ncbi:MAG: hypothetical protein ACXVH2_00835 [Methanobacterium sp.]
MSKAIKTCQVAVPFEIMERVREIKETLRDREIKVKLQEMVSKALIAYCDDMELELNK